MGSKPTPSQTVGPFFAYGLTARQYGYSDNQIADGVLVGEATPGERITITGHVYDGAGAPIPDALVEIWQADASGRYPGRGTTNVDFSGFGRQGTGADAQSRFTFLTVKPGKVDGRQAPHVTFVVFMRGLLTQVYTRLYFDDEAAANAADPVLAVVPAARRHTLIAIRDPLAPEALYRFDIRMQGKDETVFFDI
jgi:protocatechuate 3,4-dioxygenase alpha subunit